MTIRLLTESTDAEKYLDSIRTTADQHRKELAFLPTSAYEEQVAKGNLWVAVEEGSERYLGHVLFGRSFPTVRIFQTLTDRNNRREGIGRRLVECLKDFAAENGYQAVTARVASDLSGANAFYDALGFRAVQQIPGGKSTGRMLNLRAFHIDSGDLFAAEPNAEEKILSASVSLPSGPRQQSQTFAIDINVILDALKNRDLQNEALAVIREGFVGKAKLWITQEFIKELERNSPIHHPDYLLEFIKGLPILPDVSQTSTLEIVEALQTLFFPNRESNDPLSQHDKSDLIHLASSIHHGISGFVTRDKRILKHTENVRRSFGMTVLAPSDFLPENNPNAPDEGLLSASIGNSSLSIEAFMERRKSEIDQFLARFGFDASERTKIWEPGIDRRRFCIWRGESLIGLCAWDAPKPYLEANEAYLVIDEAAPGSVSAIDHALETISRELSSERGRWLVVNIPVDHSLTKETAIGRGFHSTAINKSSQSFDTFERRAFSGVISKNSWSEFCSSFERESNYNLPRKMPDFEVVKRDGVPIFSASRKGRFLGLSEFETLFNPALFLFPGRSGHLVPIRQSFADELFSIHNPQYNLLPKQEALLRIEKAFFRTPRSISGFSVNQPIVFYVSGSGGGSKEAIGLARVTYSDVISVEEAEIKLGRQGVLNRTQIENYADSQSNVHAFTFDNFQKFKQNLSISELRNIEAAKASMVTIESISHEQLLHICNIGFGREA